MSLDILDLNTTKDAPMPDPAKAQLKQAGYYMKLTAIALGVAALAFFLFLAYVIADEGGLDNPDALAILGIYLVFGGTVITGAFFLHHSGQRLEKFSELETAEDMEKSLFHQRNFWMVVTAIAAVCMFFTVLLAGLYFQLIR